MAEPRYGSQGGVCVFDCVCMSLPHNDNGWSMVVAIPVILSPWPGGVTMHHDVYMP